jgi:hypothetical protein
LIEKLDKESVRVTDFKTGSAKKKSEIEKLEVLKENVKLV